MYVEAERAIRRGAVTKYRRLAAALEDHPLRPWLRYLELRRDFPRRSDAEIHEFVSTYGETPVADRVRLLWIDRLAGQRRWSKLLAVYAAIPPEIPEVRHRCHRARALLETGRDAEGFAAVADLWRVPRSQDKACDPAFSLWVKKKGRTSQHLWERIELAMRHRNRGLARYVARKLPAAERAIVETWIREHGRPARIVSRAGRVATEPGWRIPVSASIAAIAKRKPETAARAWRKATKGRTIPADLDGFASWRIGLGFAQDHRFPEALRWIGRVPAEHRDERLLGVHALVACTEGSWEEALASLDALPPETRDELRWRYWRARILDALGQPAGALWKSLAEERDYYGFLAADRLGTEYRFNEDRNRIPKAELDRYARTPALRRLDELHALGYRRWFESEWLRILVSPDAEAGLAAMYLATSRGWFRQVIAATARAQLFDRIDLRFPLGWKNEVTANARRYELSPAWIFATIRVESAFSERARSSAGARGLMQIMPGTGRLTARSAGIPYSGTGALDRPVTNVRIGAAYLRQLLDRFGGRVAPSSAAYNAGHRRVERWLGIAPMPADLWVELIPYTETRRYVRRILEYHAVYEHRLGLPVTPLRALMEPLPSS